MDQSILHALHEVDRRKLDVEAAKERLRGAEAELQRLIGFCKHHFSDVKYDPIVTPGGSSPGDPPGTMGIDWRGPASWPATEQPRWSMTCSECGLVKYTTKSEPVPKPVW